MGLPQPTIQYNPTSAGPLDQLAKVTQLRNMTQQGQLQQQQIKADQLENQQRETALRDQQTVMQVLGQNNGDIGASLPQLAGKVTPQTYMGLAKAHYETREAALKMSNEQLANDKTRNDNLLGLIDQVKQIPPDQYAQQWPQIAQQAVKIKPELQGQIDPSKPIPQEQLGQMQLGIQAHSTIQAQVMKEREVKAQEVTAQAHADTAATSKERLAAEMPGGQLADPAKAEMADWLAKNPGKGPSDFMAYKAKLIPQFNFNLQNSGTTGNAGDVAKRFGMNPIAFDQAAEKYWTSGQLPPSGRGGPSLALNKALMNRAADLHPDGSLAANSAEYKANSESLKKFQSQVDSVNAFENTAEKNIDRLLQTAKNIPDLGSKFANVPVRMISEKMLGTESMARFHADLLTAQNEAAKVLNSANMTGVLSDSARKELQDLADGNLSYKSLSGAFDEIKFDMGNRKQSYQDQIMDIKKRLGDKNSGGGNRPDAGGGKGGLSITAPNGKTYTFKDQQSLDAFKQKAGL